MPNIRQRRERKTRKWIPEAMEQALQEVRAGRLTTRQAAQQFGVPKSTLSDRVSGRVASGCVPGQRPFLTPADENSLVEYCLDSASRGFPLTKPQVLDHALAIFNHRHPDTPKTALGQTWWINFRERHQRRLAACTPLPRTRASVPQPIPQPSVSQGPVLPAAKDTTSLAGLPAHTWRRLPPSSKPSTSSEPGLCGSQRCSSPSQTCPPPPATHHPLTSSSSPSTGPTTCTCRTAKRKGLPEPAVRRCGRCKKPDPPENLLEGLVSWVQCDNCHKWFHTTCVDWEEERGDDDQEFYCFWCLDV